MAFLASILLAACGVSGPDLPKSDFDLTYTLGMNDEAHLSTQKGVTPQNHLNGAELAGAVSVTAAIDEAIPVQEVQFFVDDVLLHTTESRPFTVVIDTSTLGAGTHVLIAEVTTDAERPLIGAASFTVRDDAAEPAAGSDPADDGSLAPTDDAPVADEPAAPEDDGSDAPDFFADLPEATLYVSTDGDDGNDGRSADSAFRTIQKAANVVEPGDTVYISGGVYTGRVKFDRSGTADRPITWTSAPGEWAILDLADAGSSERVWVYGADHNRFLNFEVRNSPNQGIWIQDGDHNLFRNIDTHHNHGSGIQNYRGNGNRFEYVTSHDNNDHSSDRPGEDADGIGVTSGEGNTIYASIAYNNSDDGFDTWKSVGTVIDSSLSHHNGYGRYGNGNGFKLGSSGHHVGTVVKNSIAYANKAVGFTWNGGHGVSFLNNTSVDNRRAFEADSTATLVNNIADGGDLSLSGAEARNNSWDLGMTPDFASTDPGAPDFLTLTPGSDALTAGEDGSHLGALQPGSTFADVLGPLDAHLASVVAAVRR